MTANEPSPAPGLPATQKAVRKAKPSTTHASGTAHLLVLVVGMEYLLHRSGEEPGQGHRERQRRRVAVRLDGVYGLTGDAHLLGQPPLGETSPRPQLSHVVVQRCKASLTVSVCQVCFTPRSQRSSIWVIRCTLLGRYPRVGLGLGVPLRACLTQPVAGRETTCTRGRWSSTPAAAR